MQATNAVCIVVPLFMHTLDIRLYNSSLETSFGLVSLHGWSSFDLWPLLLVST